MKLVPRFEHLDFAPRRRTPFEAGVRFVPTAFLALIALSSSAFAASPLQWSAPALVDHQAPFGNTFWMVGVSCPSASFCAIVGEGDAWTSSEPAGGIGTWTLSEPAEPASAVSCVSSQLCVGVNGNGFAFTGVPGETGGGGGGSETPGGGGGSTSSGGGSGPTQAPHKKPNPHKKVKKHGKRHR